MNRHIWWVLLLLLMAGCTAMPPEREGPGPQDTDDAREQPREREPEGGSSAVVALLDQADDASASGEHDRAAALLERALRIQPGNAALWHNLAIVRYRQENYGQAESMALRSNRHAEGQPQLRIRNWELIAVARELTGDPGGAEEARRRVEELRAGGGGR